MHNAEGVAVFVDDNLRQKILVAVSEFRFPVSNMEGFASAIEREVMIFREFDSATLKSDPSQKVSAYLKGLENARAAFFDMPESVREVIPLLFPYTGASLFPNDLLKKLAGARYESQMLSGLLSAVHQSGQPEDELSRLAELIEWRKNSLSDDKCWGGNVEMLDLLIASAKKYLLDHVTPSVEGKRRRYKPDVMLIVRIIPVCRKFGIEVSEADDGHFAAIVRAVMGHLGPEYRTTKKEKFQSCPPSYRHAISSAMGEE